MSVMKHYLNKEKTKYNWRAVVYISTGKYDRFGKPIKQHKHVGYYPTKSEAEKAKRDFLNKFEDGKVELNKDANFEDIFNLFLKYACNEGDYSEGTICNYKGYFKNHMQMFRYIPVKDLTAEIIQKWQRDLFACGTSIHTYNGCLKLAKAMFGYGISLKMININPFEQVKFRSIAKKPRKRFSIDELGKLIEMCRQEMPEYFCLFILATLTGARLGEYSAIKLAT